METLTLNLAFSCLCLNFIRARVLLFSTVILGSHLVTILSTSGRLILIRLWFEMVLPPPHVLLKIPHWESLRGKKPATLR